MLDDLPDIAGNAFAACFPGCFLSIALPLCTIGATIAFATGHPHEAWTQLAIAGLCVLWALSLIAGWLWRRT